MGNFAGSFLPNKQPVFVVVMWAIVLPPAILDKRSLPRWLIDGEGDQLRSEPQVSCRLRWHKYSTANFPCQGRFAPRLRARWLLSANRKPLAQAPNLGANKIIEQSLSFPRLTSGQFSSQRKFHSLGQCGT